jgi:MerR family transcriptional regulator/heat shock protein HspR
MRKETNSSKSYHISSVASMFDIHPQTLRLYEREGLLKPSRSEGNTRLYSDEDLKQLEVILNLARDLGINLAGIEVILNMRNKMELMEKEIGLFLDYIRKEFFGGREDEFESRRQALVKIRSSTLIKLD